MPHDDGNAAALTLARVWSDASVKRALMANPRDVLRQLGVVVPADTALKALGSRGAPSDGTDTLVQIVLERGPRVAFFFIPSPLHASAQQAAYGRHLGTSIDDPQFEHRMRADAEAALQELGAVVAADTNPAHLAST